MNISLKRLRFDCSPFREIRLHSTTQYRLLTRTMASPVKVLLLGVNMAPGEPFSQEDLIKMIEGDVASGKQQNPPVDISYFLMDPNNPDYEGAKSKLRAQPWDVVAIGAGVRFVKSRTLILETLANATLQNAKPLPRLAFNDAPNTVTQSVLRVMKM